MTQPQWVGFKGEMRELNFQGFKGVLSSQVSPLSSSSEGGVGGVWSTSSWLAIGVSDTFWVGVVSVSVGAVYSGWSAMPLLVTGTSVLVWRGEGGRGGEKETQHHKRIWNIISRTIFWLPWAGLVTRLFIWAWLVGVQGSPLVEEPVRVLLQLKCLVVICHGFNHIKRKSCPFRVVFGLLRVISPLSCQASG